MLEVGDGNLVYWETCGNPEGKPGLVVHGGPGSGCSTGVRRSFDPARYRVVLFDQRGCGRSTPHASDPATDMSCTTTEHLLADMEGLSEHLGIDRWLLFGGSWGSTLILAYAQRHPHRVSEIVISGVTTTRRSEIDWLYQGVARLSPGEWKRFRAGVPEADREGDLVAAYARLMQDPDPLVRAKAANAWCAWEDAVISLESNGKPTPTATTRRRPYSRLSASARTTSPTARGWKRRAAARADRLAGIPGVLIHGRHDMGGPLHTAWELARAWPDAELVTVDDAGHTDSNTLRERIRSALDKFARQ